MKLAKQFSRGFFITCYLALISVCLWAQDSSQGGETKSTTTTSTTTRTTDIDITTNGNEWYTQPWVWIVGAAVFILLLVALLSSGRSRNSVVVDKTVEKDNRID